MNCRACESKLTQFFSLGQMPLVNSFLRLEDISTEEKFDLSLGFCSTCYLVQLINTVAPERLFRDYIYFSSTSKFFLNHCLDLARELTDRLHLGADSLVIEIASNDGSQLQCFQDLKVPVLGIDPARNIAEVANQKGIPTLPEFFNSELARQLKEEKNISADLIFGANVLAHVPEIIDFARGVKTILKPSGTAVFEFPYLKGLVEKKFDTIYHEHVFYYSLITLQNLFKSVGLEVYDVELTPMQGGSLKIFISHQDAFVITDNIKNLVAEELTAGFDQLATYQKIDQEVASLKTELISLLERLKSEGKTIAAYGAAAKGNVLLNYFGISDNYLDFIVDKSEAKQGFYTPGTHLLVCPPEKIAEAKPDYLLVLCWNIADEVVEQLKDYHQQGGKFIVPVPTLIIK